MAESDFSLERKDFLQKIARKMRVCVSKNPRLSVHPCLGQSPIDLCRSDHGDGTKRRAATSPLLRPNLHCAFDSTIEKSNRHNSLEARVETTTTTAQAAAPS